MSQRIRLLAIDVDDTLIGSDLTLTEASRRSISQALAAGVRVVLATGRMFCSALPYARQLGLRDPIIAYNGGLVRELDGTTWFEQPVALQPALDVCRFAAAHAVTLNLYLDDRLYVERSNPDVDYYVSIACVPAEHVGPLEPFVRLRAAAGQLPTKMLLVDQPERVPDHIERLQALFAESLHVARSKPRFVEITQPGVSKGRALAVVAERFGILPSEVMAIGDSFNDVPMLEFAGVGVAMGHAADAVKAAADWVGPTQAEDGVAAAIQRWILNPVLHA